MTAREEIVRASKDLSDLVTGPSESVRWLAWDVSLCFPFWCADLFFLDDAVY